MCWMSIDCFNDTFYQMSDFKLQIKRWKISYSFIKCTMSIILPLVTSSSDSIGNPWADDSPRYAKPIVVARVKGIANQVNPPNMNPQTP